MTFSEKPVSDDSQITLYLNEYFSTMGRELDQQLRTQSVAVPNANRHAQYHIFYFPSSHKECLKLTTGLENLKNGINPIQVR